MINLNCYSRELYERARLLSKIRDYCLGIELIGLFILLLVSDDTTIKFFLSLIVLMHIITEYFKYKVKRYNMLAFKFDKIERLKNSYGEIPSNFELADLKSESISFYTKLKECLCQKAEAVDNYNIKNKTTHEKELLSRLQEDAFWNHHQYYKMFILKRDFIIKYIIIPILLIVSIVSILSEVEIIKTSILEFKMEPIKFILVFLSFGLLYEIVDEMFNYHRASIEMNEIDNEITRLYEKENPIQNAMSLMVKFHFVRAMCPYIDNKIYITYADGLNSSWNLRVSSSLEKAFDNLFNQLRTLNEDWAITGGMNLYLRKYKEHTKDIDIITTIDGMKKIVKLLNIKVATIENQEIEHIRSYFIQTVIDGVCIDIMAHPEYKLDNQWKELNWQKEIVDLTIDGKLVKTTSLDYEKFTQTIICKQKINEYIQE